GARAGRAVDVPDAPSGPALPVLALVDLRRAHPERRVGYALDALDAVDHRHPHHVLAREPRHVAADLEAQVLVRAELGEGHRTLAVRLPQLDLLGDAVVRVTVEVELVVAVALREAAAHADMVHVAVGRP